MKEQDLPEQDLPPLRVVPSGVVVEGRCYVQDVGCSASQSGPITIVLIRQPATGPSAEQVRVCGACFNRMITRGRWAESREEKPETEERSFVRLRAAYLRAQEKGGKEPCEKLHPGRRVYFFDLCEKGAGRHWTVRIDVTDYAEARVNGVPTYDGEWAGADIVSAEGKSLSDLVVLVEKQVDDWDGRIETLTERRNAVRRQQELEYARVQFNSQLGRLKSPEKQAVTHFLTSMEELCGPKVFDGDIRECDDGEVTIEWASGTQGLLVRFGRERTYSSSGETYVVDGPADLKTVAKLLAGMETS